MTTMSSRGIPGATPRSRHRTLALAAMIALLVSACGTSASPSVAPTGAPGASASGAASATPAPSGPKTDTSVLVAAVDNLGSQIYAPWLSGQENRLPVMLIGDTLTQVNRDTGAIEPALAESWTVSDDHKTWDFKLKPNIPFQDGYGDVTAEDVRFSFEQWLNPDSNQSNVGVLMMQAIDNDISNFTVDGPLEFTLHTENPVANLPAIMSDFNQAMTIQSKKYFDEKGDEANKHPLGTGPFKFVSNTPGVEVVLESIDSHPFRGVTAFKKLVIKEIPDSAARLAQVQGGAVDLALLDPSLIGEAEAASLKIFTIRDVENCSITLGGYYPGTPALDTTSPWIQTDPAKGKLIREAMSLAIDRQTILDRLLNGYGSLTYGPVLNFPRISLLSDPSWTPPPYDAALAKQKLAEGGYPDGFPIVFRAWEQVATAQAIVDMWNEIGIKATFETTEQALMRPLFQASNTPEGNSATNGLAWIFCNGAYPTPELNLVNAWMKTGHNMQMFNPAIDVAEQGMRTQPDETLRYQIARDLITTLREDGAPINLYTADYPWIAGPKVGDWNPIPRLNLLNSVETVTPANP